MAVGLCRFLRFVGFTGTGGIFTADFGVTFPVVGINRLDQGVESVEVVQFADSCNFVFDVAGKSIVELAAEGSVAPIDFGGELLEADNVFSNFLVIMHFESFKLIFSIGFNVERTKVGPEFGNELVIIVGPGQVGVRVHERQFKVVECCPLEEGERVVDLVHVELKCVVSVAEVEL